ncbi:serine/threonine protein kinase [Planctomicrobium piriforme]|uniref:non-specific serine/threonine protein kinase n=1 Tax=Planctomicrobium piriforme TaxID=1576369 RepID=A0A1I3J425_9PLAN|nr:serine/threonine-protein kinase [Planctomicrobium piriforme]SFI54705.1 serine/threonine protein kinase [Planctomicrobium piriforme]
MSTDSGNLRKIGPFLLDKQLGVGGMGIVYAATYEKNGLKCAVKILAPDMSGNEAVNQRFVRETEILKKLAHPNIIKYYGAGSNRTQRFYAMEMLEGGSLDNVIRQEGRLSWERTIEYSIQIARALEHAHNAGIVHRDLKPGNLLVANDGTLKLSDFGIARDTQATALTQAGKTVGTMNYMAPEQISGKYPITRSTDLYALGCVMFEMLTGRVPFQSETQAELLFKHLDEAPPSVREFNQSTPVLLAKLIETLLAKEPNDRPFDALAVQVRLDDIKEKLKQQEEKRKAATVGGITAGADQKTGIVKKKKKKKKGDTDSAAPFYERAWFLALVLCVILGGLSFAVMRARSEETLYARAEKHMLKDSGEWIHAEQDLKTMVARYPEGKHLEQGQEWLDQIEMYRIEKRIETNLKLGKDPTNESERLYLAAGQYEKFGDRITALEKYESMPKLIAMTDETRPYLNLARRQAEKIKSSVTGDSDRTIFIKKQLDEADQLYTDGKKLQSREKWQAIIRLYGDNAEFEVFTKQAKDRLGETAAQQ